eukprot:8516316-Pyramimonas_sp.AAC.1
MRPVARARSGTRARVGRTRLCVHCAMPRRLAVSSPTPTWTRTRRRTRASCSRSLGPRRPTTT